MPDSSRTPTLVGLQSLVSRLPLATYIFRAERLIYSNQAATLLADRLRSTHGIEIAVVLRHYLSQFRESQAPGPDRFALAARDQEPFFIQLIPLRGRHHDVAATIRELGREIGRFQNRYRLSQREVQVIELVLRGFSNRDIGTALGVTSATVKKHLSHIFDKVGVDSRSQLASRLA